MGNKKVHTLNLSANNIGDKGAVYFKTYLSSTGLKILNLDYNQLSATGVRLISEGLVDNSVLESLSFVGNNAKERGTKSLVEALVKNCHLKHLNITANSTGGFAMKHIAKLLVENKSLQSLHLKNNQITLNAMFRIVKEIVGNKTLQFIDLSDNYVALNKPEAGIAFANGYVDVLKNNTSLTSIDLSGNGLNAEAKALLNNAKSQNKHLGTLILDTQQELVAKNRADTSDPVVHLMNSMSKMRIQSESESTNDQQKAQNQKNKQLRV